MTRDEIIADVTRRLVDYFQPERIYLIGSTARGEHHAGSDLDFVVVLPDDAPREKWIAPRVQQRLWGVPLSVDVVPFRHSTFEARSGWLMSLPAIARREGVLRYDSASPAGR